MSEFEESIEGPEITDEEIQGFIDRGGEVPDYHPILMVWREVLRPAADEATSKVTPQWANRICSSYREVEFADMNEFRDSYFGKVLALAGILEEQIATDDECLTYRTPEEDVEHNSRHYKQLLTDWQLAMLGWELDWDCRHQYAGVELAAISEVHKQFFGPTGLTAFLDNIKFEFTESDQRELSDALEALKAGR